MTDKEREAVDYLTKYINYTKKTIKQERKYNSYDTEYSKNLTKKAKQLEIALNLIQKQQAELEKLEWAVEFAETNNLVKELEKKDKITEYLASGKAYMGSKEEIKKYFEEMVENE